MNHTEFVNAVAQKLYRFTRRDIAEVMDVMLEIMHTELLRPGGYIQFQELGKLYIEQQQIRPAGVIRQTLMEKPGQLPTTLNRYYFRFQPAETFRQALVIAREEQS